MVYEFLNWNFCKVHLSDIVPKYVYLSIKLGNSRSLKDQRELQPYYMEVVYKFGCYKGSVEIFLVLLQDLWIDDFF
jgi:hypothetical protein